MGNRKLSRPPVSLKGVKGKKLPRDQASTPLPEEPRNRRERLARAAWLRSKKVGDDGLTNAEREVESQRYTNSVEANVMAYLDTQTYDDQQ
jgi:hypothetical protein